MLVLGRHRDVLVVAQARLADLLIPRTVDDIRGRLAGTGDQTSPAQLAPTFVHRPRIPRLMTDEPFGSARSIARPKVILRSAPFAVAALPTQVEHLLVLLAAPPRLVAHLALVHHVAGQLTERVSQDWPLLDYDREAVLLGAATHDIGKIVYRDELIHPGKHHEEVGEEILLEQGFAPRHA